MFVKKQVIRPGIFKGVVGDIHRHSVFRRQLNHRLPLGNGKKHLTYIPIKNPYRPNRAFVCFFLVIYIYMNNY